MGWRFGGFSKGFGRDQQMIDIPKLERRDGRVTPPNQHQLLLVHISPERVEVHRHLMELPDCIFRHQIKTPVGCLVDKAANTELGKACPVNRDLRVHVLEDQLLVTSQIPLHPLTRIGSIIIGVIEVLWHPGPSSFHPFLVIGPDLGSTERRLRGKGGEDGRRHHFRR